MACLGPAGSSDSTNSETGLLAFCPILQQSCGATGVNGACTDGAILDETGTCATGTCEPTDFGTAEKACCKNPACPVFKFNNDPSVGTTENCSNVLSENCTLGMEVQVATGKTMDIIGAPAGDAMSVTIDRGGEASANPGRLFAVTGPDAVLQLVNLILTGGHVSGNGGAVHVSDGGIARFIRCTLTHNMASSGRYLPYSNDYGYGGGAVFVDRGTVFFQDSELSHNEHKGIMFKPGVRDIRENSSEANVFTDIGDVPSSVDVYVHYFGTEGDPKMEINCFSKNRSILMLEGGNLQQNGAMILELSPGTSEHISKLRGVADLNNVVSRREGSLTCEDVKDKNQAETLTLDVLNVRFPTYSHGSIHRGIDNVAANPFPLAYLTSVGSHNVTSAWPDPMVDAHICQSFDPEIAAKCAFGHGFDVENLTCTCGFGVVRPVPVNVPTWYAYLVSVLDIIFLDSGSVINLECIDGDALSSEKRVIVGTLLLRMVMFYGLSLVYGVAASSSLSMVTCTKSSDSTLRLRHVPKLECYSESDGTQMLAALAWLLLAVFIVPWPLASYWLVRQFYWAGHNVRGKNASEMKDMVYDFWIAKGNNILPQFYWFRSLDAALLGVSAVLSALFDNPNSIPDQIALAVTTCLLMVSYIVLLKLKDPYSELRQWARAFRYASLGTGCLASILRFLGSDIVSVSNDVIIVLAAAILILLVSSLASAVFAFEYSILKLARRKARTALRVRQAASRLGSNLESQGIDMSTHSDKDFLSNVRESFQFYENPALQRHNEKRTGEEQRVTNAMRGRIQQKVQRGEEIETSKTICSQVSEKATVKNEVVGDVISQENASLQMSCKKRETFLPTGWQKASSEEGFTYYIDPDQNSQWEKPPGNEQSTVTRAGSISWRALVDENGNTYYVNSLGESRWDLPPGQLVTYDTTENENKDEDAMEREREEDSAEILRVRNMIMSAHNTATHSCLHPNCECVATFGKPDDLVAKRCRFHKHKDDVLKLRMNTKEKCGDWEELVDNKNGKTYYFNERLDLIKFTKPKGWFTGTGSARAMQADRSASALQQRIVSMEKSLLLSEAGGSDNGALDTKARIFGDAMQNEINALKRRRSDSLKQRRRLNLMIDTEAAKLLKPAREVVRLRKSNADALEKLMTMVDGLSRATPQTRESGPIDALPFSPIRSSASQKDTDFDPDLSPMLRLPSSRLATEKDAFRCRGEAAKKATEFHP
eukprot:g2564.t1